MSGEQSTRLPGSPALTASDSWRSLVVDAPRAQTDVYDAQADVYDAPADGYVGPTEYDQVIDPDVDLHDPRQVRETRPRQWDLALVTSVGGIIGAWARYGLGLAVPHGGSAFPWSTIIINASGCVLIGALMVILLELTRPHRLVRPFLGVGILGGYTTFSTFAVDTEKLILDHRPGIALLYVVVTVVACAVAVWFSTTATLNAGRAVIALRVRRRRNLRRSR